VHPVYSKENTEHPLLPPTFKLTRTRGKEVSGGPEKKTPNTPFSIVHPRIRFYPPRSFFCLRNLNSKMRKVRKRNDKRIQFGKKNCLVVNGH